jgi:hypothetical protein
MRSEVRGDAGERPHGHGAVVRSTTGAQLSVAFIFDLVATRLGDAGERTSGFYGAQSQASPAPSDLIGCRRWRCRDSCRRALLSIEVGIDLAWF